MSSTLFQMQARSSVDGSLNSWLATGQPDWIGVGYAGTGTPQDVAFCGGGFDTIGSDFTVTASGLGVTASGIIVTATVNNAVTAGGVAVTAGGAAVTASS